MRPPLVPQRLCEIWIGRAGSGKTHGCLEAVANELIRSPRGWPLLFLVPEQATAQAERRLVTWPGVGAGFTRARVLSFERLARLALAAAAEPPPPTPGETGRVLALRRALRRHRDALLALKASAGQDGMAEAVGRALTELARYGWSPQALEDWLAPLSPADRATLPLARKAADLALLWRDYQEQLRQAGWLDQPARHAAAMRAIAGWDALTGCHAWIDGFASFTAQEFGLLEALLGQAAGATLALCADPGVLAPAGGGPASLRRRVGPERLFDNALETLRQFEDLLQRDGWLARRVALPRPGAPTRFAASPALAHLESRVLGRLVPKPFVENAGKSGAERASADWASAPPIELIEATDRRAEVQAVARRVVALCRRHEAPFASQVPPGTAAAPGIATPGAAGSPDGAPALSWRQVGVLARDLAPYAPLIREVFAQFDIPFFLDRPREVTGHPLARLLASALAVLRGNWSGRDVLHYLKTGLAWSGSADAVAKLENHVLSHDPRRRGWQDALAGIPELSDPWKTIEAPLEALAKALRAGGNPARHVWDFLDRLGVAATLEAWIVEARAQGDEEHEEQARLHEQAWDQVLGWLEDLGRMAEAAPGAFAAPGGDDAWRDRLDELAALLGSALAATRARLIPPTLNQVTVGAIDRSRVPELAVAFVLGLNEGEFPRTWNPDPLLNDSDRDRLAGPGGRRLGPDSLCLGLQEHYFVYIALTRASQAVVLSRPLTDAAGKPALAAAPFGLVAEAFPQAPRRLVGPDGQGDAPALGLRPEESNRRLAATLGALGPAGPAEGSLAAGRLAALMAAGDPLDLPGLSPARRAALLAGRRDAWAPRFPRLGLACTQAFLAARPSLSVTAVETYGQCPFKFFASAMLRLQARNRAGLTPQDLGTLRHHVLECLYERLRGPEGLRWGEIDLAIADRSIDAEMTAARAQEPYARALQAGKIQSLTMELAARDLKRFVRVLRLTASRGDCVQVESEHPFQWSPAPASFGGGPASMDMASSIMSAMPSNSSAGGGRGATLPGLTGKIDRVDRVGAPGVSGAPATWLVFDYKSGRKEFNLTRFLSGIDMQIGAYALALADGAGAGAADPNGSGDSAVGGARQIGGLFYWALAAPPPQPASDAETKPNSPDAAQAGPDSVADASNIDAAWLAVAAPSGIFVDHIHEGLDRHVMPGGPKSPAFGFKLNKKDGAVSRQSTAPWPADAFNRLLLAERRVILHALRAIADGRIAPRPYRHGKAKKACDDCDYIAICRLMAWRGTPPERPLAAMNRKKALAWLDADGDVRDPFAWPAPGSEAADA